MIPLTKYPEKKSRDDGKAVRKDICSVLPAVAALTVVDGFVGFFGSVIGGAIFVFGCFMHRKVKSSKNKSDSCN